MNLLRRVENRSARIAVIGLGYVGLPTAVNFAEQGFTVIGVNRTPERARIINEGGCYLTDLQLNTRVQHAVRNGQLSATTDVVAATKKSDVIIVTVPTPVTPDKKPDLSHVVSAGQGIASGLSRSKLVVLESTVYPGVVDEVLTPILEQSGLHAGTDFGVAYCPERYNPGDPDHTITDVVRVVGAVTPAWTEVTARLYKANARDVIAVRDTKTAEAAKIIENIQRDLNIALMNELALIFERLHIDIEEVIQAAATKWNFNVYHPGAGVGGHCLPVDPYYLGQKAKELGYHPQVIMAGRAVNDFMPFHMLSLLMDALNDRERALKNSKIAVLGLSYKENIGDHRESPSEVLIAELKKRGAHVHLVDPHVDPKVIWTFATAEATAYDALDSADGLVVMTAHDEFKGLDLSKMKGLMRTTVIVDGRRIFDPDVVRRAGFTYKGVGAA